MGRPGCLLGRLPPLSITGVFSARLRPPAVPSWAVWSCPPPCVGGRRGCAAPARYFSPGALFPFFVAVPVFSRRALPGGGVAGGGVAGRPWVCPGAGVAAPGLPQRPRRALSAVRPAAAPATPGAGRGGWGLPFFRGCSRFLRRSHPKRNPLCPLPLSPPPPAGAGEMNTCGLLAGWSLSLGACVSGGRRGCSLFAGGFLSSSVFPFRRPPAALVPLWYRLATG